MKEIISLILLFCTITLADSVKQLTLACDSYKDIINTKNIQESMKDGVIPRNCILLTSNAEVSVVDDKLSDPRIVKIFIIDLEKHMYSLKKDVIITNKNKI